MPQASLAAMGRRYGVSLAKMESFWREAKAQYGTNYAAVMGTVKKRAAAHGRAHSDARAKKTRS